MNTEFKTDRYSMYDIRIMSGYFQVKLSSIREFDSGSVISYITRDVIHKQPYNLIEFNSDPVENGNIISINDAILKHNVYKDRKTGEWIDKGIIIEILDKDILSENQYNNILLKNNLKHT